MHLRVIQIISLHYQPPTHCHTERRPLFSRPAGFQGKWLFTQSKDALQVQCWLLLRGAALMTAHPTLKIHMDRNMTHAGRGSMGVGGAVLPPTDCQASLSFVLVLEALRFTLAAATNTSATTTLDTNFGHIHYFLFSYLSLVTISSSPSPSHFPCLWPPDIA